MTSLLFALLGILGGFEANLIASRFEDRRKKKELEKNLREKLPPEINKRLRALTFKYAEQEDDLDKILNFLISPDTSTDLIKLAQASPSPQKLIKEIKEHLKPIISELRQINPDEFFEEWINIVIDIRENQPELRDLTVLKGIFELISDVDKIKRDNVEHDERVNEKLDTLIDKVDSGKEKKGHLVSWNVPFRVNPNFTGRDDEMQKLRDLLHNGSEAIISQLSQISGMGGVGKTQLAVEYAHKYKAEYAGGVLWVRGAEDVKSEYGGLEEILGLGLPINADLEDKCRQVQQCLQNRKSMTLLILDNLDDKQNYEDIYKYLPNTGGCQILITTRIRGLGDGAGFSLDVLKTDKAVELLFKESKRDGEDREIAKDICLSLGNLPLAIEVAGKYLKDMKIISFGEYYTELIGAGATSHESLLEDKSLSNVNHTANLKATLSIHRKLMDDAQIMELLAAIICFGPDSINPQILAIICGMDWNNDKKKLWKKINTLSNYSILQVQKDNRLSIHRLMRQALVEEIGADELGKMRREYVVKLQGWFRKINKVDKLKTTTPEIPHILQAAKLAQDNNIWPQAYDLCIDLGKYYEFMGRYKQSLKWGEESEKEAKNDQAKLTLSYNEIGTSWVALGEYKKATDYFELALPLSKKVYGERHPHVAAVLNNLGGTYKSLGEYNKAIEYFEQALAIDKEYSGERHPDVAICLNNLGGAYKSLGEYTKAIEYYEQALSIDKEFYGERHPKVAIRLNNLGFAYNSLGKYNKAREYYEQAHDMFLEFLGEDHPDTKAVKKNLEALEGRE